MKVRPNVSILAFATLNVHTNAWLYIARISSCARRTRKIASCQERLGHRNDNLHSSQPLRSSNALDISTNEPFPNLYGKTLVSIQECIDAYLHHQQQQSRNNHSNEHPLNNNKNTPRLQFIDASWYHRPDPKTNTLRNPSLEFQSAPRIPHSHYLDIDALATTYELFPRDNPKKLPHMMPPPDLFALAMDAYGIRQFAHNADEGGESVVDHVVIYARRGAVFTPRTWFLFLSMGHDPKRVHLMQGSLEDWMEMGGEVEYPSFMSDTDENVISCGEGYDDCFDGGILNVTKLYPSRGHDKTKIRYQTSVSRATNICEKDEVLQAVNEHLAFSSSFNPQNQTHHLPNADIANNNNSKTIIIDTRGSGYTQKGHMPSAIHLPYRQLVSPSNPLVLLPKQALHELFVSRGIRYQDPDLKIILSCGSGVSVCHAFLALTILGRRISEENTRVYDGSWKEWGRAEEELPRILPGEVVDRGMVV